MERPRVPALVAVALLVCPAFILADGAAPAVHPPPAFVEVYAGVYGGGFDIEAVRRGEFQHPYYPTVDISNFDWATSPVNKDSWWIRVEELRFLIPLIASDRVDDQVLLQTYFDGWRQAHPAGSRPNPGAWREPMTVARRGMVLAYWRMREGASAEPDSATLLLLDGEIVTHAAFLLTRYDRDSNHGLEEAMGLHELTRVTGNAEHRSAALERLISISEASVTARGIQREHSPGYHFLMLQSLDRYRTYLGGLETTPAEATDRLDVLCSRLRFAGYYLYDHGYRVLQMGDTDSLVAAEDVRVAGNGFPAILYDADGGIGVFKGRDSDRRYVAVSLTSAQPPMRRHYHNDVLALFFSHDGETLLGGSGAFEYASSQYRTFFLGPGAHSRVFHESETMQPRRLDIGHGPWHSESEAGGTFGIRLTDSKCTFRRSVIIKGQGAGIVVVDTLQGLRPQSEVARDPDPHVIAWQIGPDVRSARMGGAPEGGGCIVEVVTGNGRRFQLSVTVTGSTRWTARIVRGSIRPMQGWYSPLPRVRRERSAAIITVPHERGDVVVTTGIELVD